MAYVRKRTTRTGAVSTALVESWRDGGKVRQRVLANLHGMPDVLSALAKLAAQRESLRTERERLKVDREHAETFYEVVTTNTLAGHRYSAGERKEIDRLLKQRERLLKRLAKVESGLSVIQRDGGAIRKHCAATDAEIQAAITSYKAELNNKEAAVAGSEYFLEISKAELRRLRL